ncbi:MAG: methionine--tRNA ligase [Bacteroidetes bacterium]|nr:methionine--tRNA ligase [Bacteroidota bacterium]
MSSKSFKRTLVTSALPYTNGPIHIGHLAGAYLPADMHVRYLRLSGQDVVYVCGSDEFGVAILIQAMQNGITARDVIDRYHPLIRDSFAAFGISFDHYSRTSKEVHIKTSQEFFQHLADKNEFVLKREEHLYDPVAQVFLADRFVCGECPYCGYEHAYGDQCERCGASLSPTEIKNPRSTLTDAVPELRETTHWYLPLGKWQTQLEQYIAQHPEWKPNVLGQIGAWFSDGLRDRAITRDVPWGVAVPQKAADVAGVNAEGKVIYVWFDAPIGYISSTKEWAASQGDPDLWKLYWQDDESRLIHFIGKDNIVFHTLMFPAMLMAHGGYVVPNQVPANEFLNIEGAKLSTSRGWAVWLHEYLEDFPPDLLRYSLATILPESKDSDFNWYEFQAKVNSELADILGNFVHRALTFAEREFDNKVPPLSALSEADQVALDELTEFPTKIGDAYQQFRFREAVRMTMNVARLGNKYFNDQTPWITRKSDPSQCANTIHISLQICAALSVFMDPVLPFSAEKLRRMIGLDGVRSSTPSRNSSDMIDWNQAGTPLLPVGHALGSREILFHKITDDQIQIQMAKLNTSSSEQEPIPYAETKPEIVYDDFAKMDFRTGKILSAEPVPKSKRLLKLEVDLGFETRQILAGVAEHFQPKEMVGRSVVVVANLAPRKMMGLESQGMVLMAEDPSGNLSLVSSESDPGSVVC